MRIGIFLLSTLCLFSVSSWALDIATVGEAYQSLSAQAAILQSSINSVTSTPNYQQTVQQIKKAQEEPGDIAQLELKYFPAPSLEQEAGLGSECSDCKKLLALTKSVSAILAKVNYSDQDAVEGKRLEAMYALALRNSLGKDQVGCPMRVVPLYSKDELKAYFYEDFQFAFDKNRKIQDVNGFSITDTNGSSYYFLLKDSHYYYLVRVEDFQGQHAVAIFQLIPPSPPTKSIAASSLGVDGAKLGINEDGDTDSLTGQIGAWHDGGAISFLNLNYANRDVKSDVLFPAALSAKIDTQESNFSGTVKTNNAEYVADLSTNYGSFTYLLKGNFALGDWLANSDTIETSFGQTFNFSDGGKTPSYTVGLQYKGRSGFSLAGHLSGSNLFQNNYISAEVNKKINPETTLGIGYGGGTSGFGQLWINGKIAL